MSETLTVEEQAEALEPSKATRTVTIGVGDYAETFTQRPLSFFGKMQLMSLIGQGLDRATAGPDGLKMSELFDTDAITQDPKTGKFSIQGMDDTQLMFQILAKVAAEAPELMLEMYCIFLGVPGGSRPRVKAIMQLSEEEGGLSDEDGMGILETAIDQNWEVVLSFFSERVMPMVKQLQGKLAASQSSKPSRATRRRTQKA